MFYVIKHMIELVEMPSPHYPMDKNVDCMLNFRHGMILKVGLEVPYFMRGFNFLFIGVAII